MAPVDTVASIILLAAMDKAVLAIACCDALSAVAQLGDAETQQALDDAVAYLAPSTLRDRVVDEHTDALLDRLTSIIERTEEEPEGPAFFPYCLTVAFFYALHILRRGPEQSQMRWFLTAALDIVDSLDDEHPGFEVTERFWQGVDGAVAVLLATDAISPRAVDDVWHILDGLRATMTAVVATITTSTDIAVEG